MPSPTPDPMVALCRAADSAIEEVCSPLSNAQELVAFPHFTAEIQGIDSKIYPKQMEAAIKLSILLQQAALVRGEFSKRLQSNEEITKSGKLYSGSSVEDREMRLKHFGDAIRKQWEVRAIQLRTAIEQSRLSTLKNNAPAPSPSPTPFPTPASTKEIGSPTLGGKKQEFFIQLPTLEFKDFSLNMSYAGLLANIEKHFGKYGAITSETKRGSWTEFNTNKRISVDQSYFYLGSQTICFATWEPNTNRQFLRSFSLFSPFSERLFNADGSTYDAFFHFFFKAYNLPGFHMDKHRFLGIFEHITSEHASKEGWLLRLHYSYAKGTSVSVERTKQESSMTFGD